MGGRRWAGPAIAASAATAAVLRLRPSQHFPIGRRPLAQGHRDVRPKQASAANVLATAAAAATSGGSGR
eukprot:SAG22_NODE_10315_length_541_cov_1.959276_2_plen_68_part_01